jgi:hypothetical protein
MATGAGPSPNVLTPQSQAIITPTPPSGVNILEIFPAGGGSKEILFVRGDMQKGIKKK